MLQRCHLIVNSLETRGDNIATKLTSGTRHSYFPVPTYESVPPIYKTSHINRYSRLPQNISPDETNLSDLAPLIGGVLALSVGALQRPWGNQREIQSNRGRQFKQRANSIRRRQVA